MPNYKYKCDNGHEYMERRPSDMEQIYKDCQNCGAKLSEIKE